MGNTQTEQAKPEIKALHERAMLVELSFSYWTGRKFDKQASDETADAHKSDRDMLSTTKMLVRPEVLKPITQVDNEIRAMHRKLTLPWGKNGVGIILADQYLNYLQKMGALKQKREQRVDFLLKLYPTLLEQAPTLLGDLYDPSDYPTPEQLRRRFRVSIEPSQVPDSEDFRCRITGREAAEIRAEMDKNLEDRLDKATKAIYTRLAKVIARMIERLSQYKTVDGKLNGVFKATLVTNIKDLVGIIPDLNLLGDPKIEALCKEIDDKLCSEEADILRQDEVTRQAVLTDAEAIYKKMQAYL